MWTIKYRRRRASHLSAGAGVSYASEQRVLSSQRGVRENMGRRGGGEEGAVAEAPLASHAQ